MSFQSKSRVTKSLNYLIVLMSITILSVIFQGCEKEELDILTLPQDYGLCNVTQISMSELPNGIEPLKVHSQKEFDNIIYQLNNLQINVKNGTQNRIILEKGGEIVVDIFTNKLENLNIPRLKTRYLESGSGIIDTEAENVGGLSVLIHLAYTYIGSSITVTSTESSSSWFLGWKQTAGVASFANNNNNIQYSVRGDVITYVLFESSLFEVSRTNYSIDGNINLRLL